MYNRFFGFKERPFKLVPNPAYLFLSQSHLDAMAHLVYAVGSGDGFVELTGEVGTGKTTLCRAFLEQLDKNTEVAYILNPVLDPEEFIRAVIDEFGIAYKGNTAKELMDTLNAFLIEKKSQSKTVLLLIDEAQNLTRDVLEQIRLISNLETTQSKLLQIVLVGQPELSILLGSYDLRQLKQRITLSCRLQSLNYKETVKYIQHRLKIASGKDNNLFSPKAVRKIFKYSQGIPRLINISCDRSLLTAYALDQKRVGGKVVSTALKEIRSAGPNNSQALGSGKKAVLTACTAAAVFLAAWYSHDIIGQHLRKPPPVSVPTQPAVVIQPIQPPQNINSASTLKSQPEPPKASIVPEPEPKPNTAKSLEALFHKETADASRGTAFNTVLALWDIDSKATYYVDETADDFSFFKLAARQNGMDVYRIEDDLNRIIKLSLPAIFKFAPKENTTPLFLVLTGTAGEKLLFKNTENGEMISALPHEIRDSWTGTAYIPWKNFFVLTDTIPLDAPSESIITLKLLLKDLGFENIVLSPKFDDTTCRAVKVIQLKHGLPVDGVVGSMTKIALYREKKSLKLPYLLDLNLPVTTESSEDSN